MSEPSTELLPCPLCSGTLLKGRRWGDKDYLQNAQCNTCLVTFSIHYPDKDGISILNRRANRWSAFSEDELRELNDAGFFLQETEAELTRRAADKQERGE